MHRTILAATVGVLLLTVSACGDDSASTATPAASSAGAATTAAVEPTPAAEDVDYSADNKKVCAKVDKLLEGKEMERFAQELGQLIVYKQAKQTAKAKEAREDAKKELKNLAAAVRRDTGAAKDPELKAAGEESAVSIEKTAGDNAFFTKIKTIKDVDKNLESEMTPWLTPLASYCA
jgi:hypothetical protein